MISSQRTYTLKLHHRRPLDVGALLDWNTLPFAADLTEYRVYSNSHGDATAKLDILYWTGSAWDTIFTSHATSDQRPVIGTVGISGSDKLSVNGNSHEVWGTFSAGTQFSFDAVSVTNGAAAINDLVIDLVFRLR